MLEAKSKIQFLDSFMEKGKVPIEETQEKLRASLTMNEPYTTGDR